MDTPESKVDQLQALMAHLTPRGQINLLLRLGVPADIVMGIPTCAEHEHARPLSQREPLTFDGDSVWCKGCWKWWRLL